MEFDMLKHTGAMFVYPEQKISSYLGTRLYVPMAMANPDFIVKFYLTICSSMFFNKPFEEQQHI
jgi:hypothetical protein